MARPNIFISYSRQDQRILRSLLPYLESLRQQNFAEIWTDTQLKGGDLWREEIETALNSATVAVLLISQSFLASRFIYEEELPRIFRRQSEGKLTVLPVYLSPSTVTSASIPFFDNIGTRREVMLADFQGFGTPERTLKELPPTERDRRFLKLHERIKELATSATQTAPANGVGPVAVVCAQTLSDGDELKASRRAAMGTPNVNSSDSTQSEENDFANPERRTWRILSNKYKLLLWLTVGFIAFMLLLGAALLWPIVTRKAPDAQHGITQSTPVTERPPSLPLSNETSPPNSAPVDSIHKPMESSQANASSKVRVDGMDLVADDVLAGWFGGDHDPQGSGFTFGGVDTKHILVYGCSLPVGLRGSPLPRFPMNTTVVEITSLKTKIQISVPLIDIGPRIGSPQFMDLTRETFKLLGHDPAEGFIHVSYRIKDGVSLRMMNCNFAVVMIAGGKDRQRAIARRDALITDVYTWARVFFETSNWQVAVLFENFNDAEAKLSDLKLMGGGDAHLRNLTKYPIYWDAEPPMDAAIVTPIPLPTPIVQPIPVAPPTPTATPDPFIGFDDDFQSVLTAAQSNFSQIIGNELENQTQGNSTVQVFEAKQRLGNFPRGEITISKMFLPPVKPNQSFRYQVALEPSGKKSEEDKVFKEAVFRIQRIIDGQPGMAYGGHKFLFGHQWFRTVDRTAPGKSYSSISDCVYVGFLPSSGDNFTLTLYVLRSFANLDVN